MREVPMKKSVPVFVLLMILLTVLGCSQANKIEQIALHLESTFNSRDAAACAELYTEDSYYVVVGRDKPLRGREEIEASFRQTFTNFPDVKAEFTNIVVSGNTFIVEGTSRGTYQGKPIEYSYAFFAEVTPEGLISEDRTYIDSAALQRQMEAE
jgi:uncharacterized protein (TIGR02246 family)